jgi:hypothetical protein
MRDQSRAGGGTGVKLVRDGVCGPFRVSMLNNDYPKLWRVASGKFRAVGSEPLGMGSELQVRRSSKPRLEDVVKKSWSGSRPPPRSTAPTIRNNHHINDRIVQSSSRHDESKAEQHIPPAHCSSAICNLRHITVSQRQGLKHDPRSPRFRVAHGHAHDERDPEASCPIGDCLSVRQGDPIIRRRVGHPSATHPTTLAKSSVPNLTAQ